MIEVKNKIKKTIRLKFHNYLISNINTNRGVDKDALLNIAINLASSYYFEYLEGKENSSDYLLTVFRIIDDFYRENFPSLYINQDSTDLLIKYQNRIRREKQERNNQIEKDNQKSFIKLFVDNENLTIQLNNDIQTNQPTLNMDYLGVKISQTIGIEELTIDLKNLTPKTFRDHYNYNDEYAFSVMYYKLEDIIELHIKKYNRLLQADLLTYVAESILIISEYQEQILKKPFNNENKKSLFNQYYYDFQNKIFV